MAASPSSEGSLRLRDHRPEMANLWQRHSLTPRLYPSAAWVDLAAGVLIAGPSKQIVESGKPSAASAASKASRATDEAR